ncbi:MAG: RNA polymerase sigma factor [Candidatus Kapaibacterium sp.]
MPEGKDLENRQAAVLETIYLLFNEGYSASKGNDLIRYELCEEAIRLAQMLAHDNTTGQKGNVYALLSLMFLNASRFKARRDGEGNLLTMAEQDRSLWDKQMQGIGLRYLQRSTETGSVSVYLILAAISANYCIAPDYQSTDWKNILALYDSLVRLDSSPLVLLNRAISLSKVDGAEKALVELEQIKEMASMKSYHLFYSTQAEFYKQLHDTANAVKSLERAIELAPLQAEKDLLRKKIQALQNTSLI